MNQELTDLIAGLTTSSSAFRLRWVAHEVRLDRRGTTRFHHPAVGELDLTFDTLELPDHPGLTLQACTATPGSTSEDQLTLLAGWAATSELTGSQVRASDPRCPARHSSCAPRPGSERAPRRGPQWSPG